MRVPMSWLREYADLPDVPARDVAAALVRAGLEVERVDTVGEVTGVVVGEVLDYAEEPQRNGKTIRWCQVAVGEGDPRGIVCGAGNFAVGDRVPVALPGAVLPGDFQITARKTYGHVSDGMICSARELGVGDEHSGILVLPGRPVLGADVVALLGLRDEVLDIAVTPDRGYCLSVRGVAREAATAYDVAFFDPGRRPVPAASGPAYDVVVADPTGCDRFVTRVVRGLNPAAVSPPWLQRRLHLAGMRPISLAVDVTNYVMLDLGQPLHAYDLDRLAGLLRARRAEPGERLVTLDGVTRTLHERDLVIADDSGPLGLAGLMGGASSEIQPDTTALVLEAAHFDPAVVAATSRRLRLSSEASRRFERGVDPDLGPAATQIAATLLVELGGATAEPGCTDVDHRPARPVIDLDLHLPTRLTGAPLDDTDVVRHLEAVGCVVALDGDAAEVVPPSWRPDLRLPVDLVEEVARLAGYDTIPSVLPPAPAGGGLTAGQRLRRRVGRTLAASGYAEVAAPPFLGPADLEALGLPDVDVRRTARRLTNPLSDEAPLLRTTLLPGLLAVLARNVRRGRPDVAVFEEGLVFLPRPAGGGPVAVPRSDGAPTAEQIAELERVLPLQPRHVAVALCGRWSPPGWWGPGRPADWSDAVEAARRVVAETRVVATVSAGERAPWHPGRCAELRVAGVAVGHAGELHPRVVEALGLPPRTCAAELDLDLLTAETEPLVRAPALSTYPAALQDVALVVAERVPAGDVAAALRVGVGPLLEDLRLFDVYTGPPVPPGHKSLAYTLRLRAADRTLTAEEAGAARDLGVREAERAVGAVLRG